MTALFSIIGLVLFAAVTMTLCILTVADKEQHLVRCREVLDRDRAPKSVA